MASRVGKSAQEGEVLIRIIYSTRGIIMMIPGGPLLRPINFVITSLVVSSMTTSVERLLIASRHPVRVCQQPSSYCYWHSHRMDLRQGRSTSSGCESSPPCNNCATGRRRRSTDGGLRCRTDIGRRREGRLDILSLFAPTVTAVFRGKRLRLCQEGHAGALRRHIRWSLDS